MKKLLILGAGCEKCERLAENTHRAAQSLGIAYELEKVSDMDRILQFGIMVTPALVVDGMVKCVGKVPDAKAIAKLLA